MRIGSTLGMSEEDLEDFVTAVGEAFANAVVHAQTSETIEIDLTLDDSHTLVAIVRDRGRGIHGVTIGDRLPPAAAERGRGIPLMRRCTSTFAISTHPAGGTLVVMTWQMHRRGTFARVTHGFAGREASDNRVPAENVNRLFDSHNCIVDIP